MQVTVSPRGSMDQLSKAEIQQLQISAKSPLYQLYRRCSLAVLSSGAHIDNAEAMMNNAKNFDINILCVERGIKIELINPPKEAFVDGKIMRGIQEHLFSVLRDVLFLNAKLLHTETEQKQDETTNFVFNILRNARALSLDQDPNLIVCWGGHSINEYEYNYTKEVGYQLGLRELDICTGCGPGAMKGPMKGASIGHAKQRTTNGRFVGLTEPSIIAAEPPNQIVNHLIILPDIEKRLEAFVRISHGIIIFPGGVGTAEELLYLLGIKLHQNNQNEPLPMVLTGPKKSEAYFKSIDNLVGKTLGKAAQAMYEIIIDDPIKVAQVMRKGADNIKDYRKQTGDSFQFNWGIFIDHAFQTPFIPTHENMSKLDISKHKNKAHLAATLRCVFSGIVAGNVKSETVQQIKAKGRFQLHGEPEIMQLIDKILQEFIEQGRMKLPGSNYEPCYDIL